MPAHKRPQAMKTPYSFDDDICDTAKTFNLCFLDAGNQDARIK
jgi:hypothetical protein